MRSCPLPISAQCLAIVTCCSLLFQFVAVSPAHATTSGPNAPDAARSVDSTQRPPAVVQSVSVHTARFEPNLGQADSRVRFVARGHETTLFLTSDSLVMSIPESTTNPVNPPPNPDRELPRGDDARFTAFDSGSSTSLRVAFGGIGASAAVDGENLLSTVVNDLHGRDPNRWRRDIPTYGAVRYSGLYDGVDVVCYRTAAGYEFDIVVQPGADPAQVRLEFEGQNSSSIAPNGDLVLGVGEAEVRCRRPSVFQPGDGGKRPVAASYELRADGAVGFVLGDYDRSGSLVIDPVITVSRAIGSSATDGLYSSSSWTSSGRLFAAGFTAGSDFPTTTGPNQHRSTGGSDIVALEFDPNTLDLVSSSYLGGSGDEYVYDIDVTPAGGIAITGTTTSRDFPLRAAFQSTFPDAAPEGTQGFVLVYRPAVAEVVFSTFLGGSQAETIEGIAVAPGGDVVVTGSTDSADFPVLAGLGTPFNGGIADAVVARFTATGLPIFSTYLGGSMQDRATGVAVDDSGAVYVTGWTSGPDSVTQSFIPFPVVNGAQQQFGGQIDTFVTKLSPLGSAIEYSTYLGGRRNEFGQEISVDGDRNAYLAGTTESSDFPTTIASPGAGKGFQDVYITKLNPAGSALTYSIVTGGSAYEYVTDLDISRGVTVTGTTESTDMPTLAPAQATSGGGYRDGFIIQLGESGAVSASSYFGGPGIDQLNSAVDDGSGGLFLFLFTSDPSFLSPSLPAIGPTGGFDGVIARYVASPAVAPPAAPASLVASAVEPGRIDLDWVDSSTDELAFKVERRITSSATWQQIAIVSANVDSFADGTVDAGVGYTYRVRSSRSPLDSSYSNEASATAAASPGTPSPPSFVTARASIGGSISVVWSDGSRNETGFDVERSIASGPWTPVTSTIENTTWIVDPAPPVATVVAYRVRSFNQSGVSDWTVSANVQTPTLPSAPTGLSAQQEQHGGVVSLGWTDGSDNESGFRVERKIGVSGTWTDVAVNSANSASLRDFFLAPGVEYIYRVSAFNNSGSSAYTPEAGVVLTYNFPSGFLNVFSPTPSTIGVQWSGANNATGFEIERRPAAGGPFAVVFRKPSSGVSGSFVDSALPASTAFVYRGRPNTGSLSQGLLYGSYTAEVSGSTTAAVTAGAVVSVNSNADSNSRDAMLTFREAVLVANGSLAVGSLTPAEQSRVTGTPSTPGYDEVVFAIGSGPVRIDLTSALPAVTDPVRIDARTQPGYAGVPVVEIAGAGVSGGTANGLLVNNALVSILGFAITGFPADGVQIVNGSGSTVSDCTIGANAAGGAGLGNDGDGISTVDSSGCTISGNLISGNGASGVNLTTSGAGIYGAHVITANRIGTTASGLAANPNAVGVRFDVNVGGTVGGQSPTARNIVSGNSGDGVLVVGTSTGSVNVFGNYIGLATDGVSPLPNGGYGIRSSRNFTYVRYGNVVSANALGGILIEPSEVAGPDFFVYESFIGTDATGMLARGNGGPGIDIDGHNYATIGSALGNQGNVVGGNAGPGVRVRNFCVGVSIAGNAIGTDRSGQLRIGNLGDGILVDGPARTRIGGFGPESRNRIAFNAGAGVFIPSGDIVGATSNQIYENAGLAIDLGPAGPTPNDVGDADTGANGLQNAPVLTGAAYTGSLLSVGASVNSLPSTEVRVEFFAQLPPPMVGSVTLGARYLTTDSGGMADASLVVQRRLPGGSRIWAVASRIVFSQHAESSEPSNTVPILGGGPPPGSTTVGVYVPATGAWFVRNSNSPGPADATFSYGPGGPFRPIEGDWNGDGTDTPGIYDVSTGAFFLRNSSGSGGADIVFTFGGGGPGFVPLAGDWDGDGVDTIGLYVPSTGVFFLRNTNGNGPADVVFTFGPGGAPFAPLVGDWNGDGIDSIGLYVASTATFFLKNTNAPGGADLAFSYGPAGASAVTGDWDGDGVATIGVYVGSTGAWFLRNSNAPGSADLVFTYGPTGATAITGNWDGL